MKHSDATLVRVTIRDDGTMLMIEVTDDGRGGAAVAPTGGLHISSIFVKLGLVTSEVGHRRVMAVLAFLHDA